MDIPAVWTVARGADEEKLADVLGRLAEHLSIAVPAIKDGNVMLPANYPKVARALDRVEPDWRDETLMIPPVA